jgi:hypothetical protein
MLAISPGRIVDSETATFVCVVVSYRGRGYVSCLKFLESGLRRAGIVFRVWGIYPVDQISPRLKASWLEDVLTL